METENKRKRGRPKITDSPYQTDEYRKWDRERARERSKGMKTIAVKLHQELQKDFKMKCQEHDLNMNSVIKLLIKNWINGGIAISVNINNNRDSAPLGDTKSE